MYRPVIETLTRTLSVDLMSEGVVKKLHELVLNLEAHEAEWRVVGAVAQSMDAVKRWETTGAVDYPATQLVVIAERRGEEAVDPNADDAEGEDPGDGRSWNMGSALSRGNTIGDNLEELRRRSQTVAEPDPCDFQAGQMVCDRGYRHEGRHNLIDPFKFRPVATPTEMPYENAELIAEAVNMSPMVAGLLLDALRGYRDAQPKADPEPASKAPTDLYVWLEIIQDRLTVAMKMAASRSFDRAVLVSLIGEALHTLKVSNDLRSRRRR